MDNAKKGLGQIRSEIDSIDNKIISLLAKRVSLVKRIGEYKNRYNRKILDLDRIKQMLKEKEKLAKRLDLDVDLVNNIFKKIIEDSMKTQKRLKKQDNEIKNQY